MQSIGRRVPIGDRANWKRDDDAFIVEAGVQALHELVFDQVLIDVLTGAEDRGEWMLESAKV